MSPEERKKVNKKVVFFAGKAAPGYYIAKLVRTCIRPGSGAVLTRKSDDSPHRERGEAHQRRPRHQPVPVALLPSRLLRLTRRDPHPGRRHLAADLDGGYRGQRHIEHEVLLERWSSSRHG